MPTVSKRASELLQEFLVIVLGVFIAVAAESWWSDREHRQFERDLREDMVAEFEANLRILESDIAENEQARRRMGLLEGLSDDALFAIPDTALSAQLDPYLIWAGFDPAMGNVQALVESGNIGAISDREMRLRLTRWAGLLEQRRRFNLQAVDFQHREVLPVIAHAGSDLRWSESERRELRTLLGQLLALHNIVLQNQHELHGVAQDILVFLRDGR
jgi:hypothetical protein